MRRETPGLEVTAMAFVFAGCGGPGNGVDLEVLNQDPELVAVGADLYATACATLKFGSCCQGGLR